jgi:hypothetical protein
MSTYDEDFYGWTREQADYLRHDKWEKVDVLHVAEEIESLGIHDEHAITRQLQRLLLHLLKWHYQPTHRTPSWRRSIRQARDAINDRTDRSHSLRDYPAERLDLAYRRARRDAAEDTGLPQDTFPVRCPWEIDEILLEGFLPPDQEREDR